MERRLTAAQVAEAWGVSRAHVYNLAHRGELPAIRIGAAFRFRPEDVRAYECRDQRPPNLDIPSHSAAPAGPFNGGTEPQSAGFRAGLRIARERRSK